MINVLISGCCGRMGRVIAEMLDENDHFQVVAGVDVAAETSSCVFPVFKDFTLCSIPVDVVIDFSRPATLPGILAYVKSTHTPLVLATTGYTAAEQASIEEASAFAPVFKSANMSLGVNLLLELLEQTTRFLGNSFDIEIIEKHHNRKIDAPSGTALAMANVINNAAGGDLELVYERHSKSEPRKKRELGIHSIRGGTIVGEHRVIFAGIDEVIEINHIAQSRQIFAQGAIRAAAFIVKCGKGLYSMQDIISKERIVTRAYYSTTDAVITVWDIPSAAGITEIFNLLGQSGINIDMISQPAPVGGRFILSFSLPKEDLPIALDALLKITRSDKFEALENIVKLSVEGSGMERQSGAAALVFNTLSGLNIPVYLITTSETKISCCVPLENAEAALHALKKQFSIE